VVRRTGAKDEEEAYAFAQFSEEPKWLMYFRQFQQVEDPAISNKISAKLLQLGRHQNAFYNFHSHSVANTE